MWPNTKLTKILKTKLPLLQAPMAGNLTSAKLIANVSNAGGLGSLGAGYLQPDAIRNEIKQIRALTDKPFAVNLFIPHAVKTTPRAMQTMVKTLKKVCHPVIENVQAVVPPYAPNFDKQLQVLLDEKISIFSFTFGLPSDKWIKILKQEKIILIGTATTPAEAKLLERKGVDIVVAQGAEAGGHRGVFLDTQNDLLLGSMTLIPQIVDQVSLPVIAAGGIMDARGVAAALALGAAGVAMGTAFLTCPKAITHPNVKKILLSKNPPSTVLTRAFSGHVARGINNKFISAMKMYEQHILPYPIQNSLTRQIRIAATKRGDTDFMSMWSGQGAPLSRGIAADKLVKELDKNVRKLLFKNKE